MGIVLALMLLCAVRPLVLSLSTARSKLNDLLSAKHSQFPFLSRDRNIETLVSEIESSSGSIKNLEFPQLWERLSGDWELIYTNDAALFAQRSKGFELFPPLKSVQQVIHPASSKAIQNILRFDSFSIILSHSADVQSNCSPAQLSLDLDVVETTLPLPAFPFEKLVPFPLLRRGYFDVS